MSRTTIDFGIDLGTTNSAVAVASGADATVLRNNLQREYTPSAVYVNRSDKVYVGERAKERVEADPQNACSEFKLQMGTRGDHKTFEASGRSMTPEELSGEVLKSLRGDVQKSRGEDISSAVITVPAAFELDQCDATRRAAELAGLGFAPLIQEPTAAAWAYSAGGAPDRAFWLVYDFGGGTFDAAVIKVADGEFVVVNHAGDNFLGGKLIDWGVVDQLLVPAVHAQLGLTELSREDRRWAGNIAKLKAAAENAKIQLSQTDTADVEVELKDGDGGELEFSYELTRADVERVALPLYRRSITLCRQALSEKGLGTGDVERVLLVGGATLAPSLRELLADPQEGLGIPLDHSQDPVTVVARGAAIFASTQRLPADRRTAATPGTIALDFESKLVGPDTEPLVGGRARAEQERDWTGSTIEFVDEQARPAWRSGQIALGADGVFATRLRAQEMTTNTYAIEFRDPQGTLLGTDPEQVTYRHTGIVGRDSVLSHSLGVGLDDNEVEWLLPKGTELPASKRVILRSTVDVHRSAGTGLIRVPIVEGERPRADRNTLIGRLDLRPDEVKRDVPAGSEVEVLIQIDRSFTPRADAYVPLLDEEFDIEVELGRTVPPDLTQIVSNRSELHDRYNALHQDARELGATDTLESLERFEADGTLDEINRLVTAAEVDPDAAQTCRSRLRDAETELDKAEESLRLPQAVADARATLESIRDCVDKWGGPLDRQDLADAEKGLNDGIRAEDQTVIRRQVEVLQDIGRRVLDKAGMLDAVIFGVLEQKLSEHPSHEVQALLDRGRRALEAQDTRELRVVIDTMRAYAPQESTDALGRDSTVGRG